MSATSTATPPNCARMFSMSASGSRAGAYTNWSSAGLASAQRWVTARNRGSPPPLTTNWCRPAPSVPNSHARAGSMASTAALTVAASASPSRATNPATTARRPASAHHRQNRPIATSSSRMHQQYRRYRHLRRGAPQPRSGGSDSLADGIHELMTDFFIARSADQLVQRVRARFKTCRRTCIRQRIQKPSRSKSALIATVAGFRVVNS